MALQVYNEVLAIARAEGGLVGTFFWSAISPTFTEPDEFAVTLHRVPARDQQEPESQDLYLVEGSGALYMPSHAALERVKEQSDAGDSPPSERMNSSDVENANDAVLLDIIQRHAISMSSLNAGWLPDCQLM